MYAINVKFAGLAFAAALATGAATLLATGAPVQAAAPIAVEAAQTPAARVAHADLNLNAAAGVNRLEARVRRAARRLCVEPGARSLKALADRRACVNGAIEQAGPQVKLAIARQAISQSGAGGK